MVKACEMKDSFREKLAKMKSKKMKQQLTQTKKCHCIPLSILDELAARFMINVPEEEKDDLMRICFQLELSHWFYIDFYVPNNPELAEGTIQEFAAHMFNHVDYLNKYANDVENILQKWMIYKVSVPVNGAILLNKNMDKILLVKSLGRTTWAFPKGKINQDEEKHHCAAREVYEETGFDPSSLIDPDLYLERVINNQTVRLYLVAGVEESFPFKPRSRGEIGDIRWWDVTTLPTSLGDKATKQRLGLSVNQFYNAIPFIRDVQSWVTELCVKKASWRSLEHVTRPELEYKMEAKEFSELNNVYTENSSEVFCPVSWQNFKLNFPELEQYL